MQNTAQRVAKREWPGLFSFIIGIAEATIGGVIMPFNPVAGGILIGDGVSRIVQGIQENIETNNSNNPAGTPTYKPPTPPTPSYDPPNNYQPNWI